MQQMSVCRGSLVSPNEMMWMLELVDFQDVDVKGDWTDEALNLDHEKR